MVGNILQLMNISTNPVLVAIETQIQVEKGDIGELSEQLRQKYLNVAKLTQVHKDLSGEVLIHAQAPISFTPRKGHRKPGDPPTIDEMLDQIMADGGVWEIEPIMKTLIKANYKVKKSSVNTTMHRRAKEHKVERVAPGKFRLSNATLSQHAAFAG